MLHKAVHDGEIGVIKSILGYSKLPFDINSTDFDNMTALDYAINSQNQDIIDLLLNDQRINANIGGKILNSSLNFCINSLKLNYVRDII